MYNLFNKLFKSAPSERLKELFNDNAELIDVRTKEEFDGRHIKRSINIPLDKIHDSIEQLDKNKPYIIVCASGIRSRNAMNILKDEGFKKVYNGGSWTNFL